MAAIYNNALLTIIAVAARNTNSSLPGVRPNTRWKRSWVSDKLQLTRPLRPDKVLKAIDRSLYVSRGWTFEERLLSRRCLYFFDEQVYLQCRSELWCEEPQLIGMTLKLGGDSTVLDFRFNLLVRTLRWVESIRFGDYDVSFNYYADLVADYSSKQLSFPSDIMNAFSGVITALEGYSGWSFIHGLPEELFDCAFLWIPKAKADRRYPASPALGSYFPSWSWFGWTGEVFFRITEQYEIQDFSTELTFRIVRRYIKGKTKRSDWEVYLGARATPSELQATLENVQKISTSVGSSSKSLSQVQADKDQLGSILRFQAFTVKASRFTFEDSSSAFLPENWFNHALKGTSLLQNTPGA
ncbi:hypothetical protein M501DRAFT_1015969 [Patellaria atrata CBS 101060]|uniref:Heterokaryon incompatibility domain-containing protein n=1 Tax=Patellaria atrata CBS 101060 TaxID=1346257 RepID=A0A9P4SC14_9PEZI|nr:hypothetical protein M501DRAFT_1015969 [Patellaria atrata CBS 101060]